MGLKLNSILREPPNTITPCLLPQLQTAAMFGGLAQHHNELLAVVSAWQGRQHNFRKGLHRESPRRVGIARQAKLRSILNSIDSTLTTCRVNRNLPKI